MWLSLWTFLRLLGNDIFGKLRPVSAVILRKGDRFLIVKKPRKNHSWQFPQGGREEGETDLEAAQRELLEECGTDLKVQFLKRKWGVYRYFFPENFNRWKDYRGARVTFFMAQYQEGEIHIAPDELEDYVWVTGDQLRDYFDEPYGKRMEKMIHKALRF